MKDSAKDYQSVDVRSTEHTNESGSAPQPYRNSEMWSKSTNKLLDDTDPSTKKRVIDREIYPALAPTRMERLNDFRGRHRRWPGALGLVVGGIVAITWIVVAAMRYEDEASSRFHSFEKEVFHRTAIKGGAGDIVGDEVFGDEIISDDGAIGNPKKYPATSCELPNYLSKNGKIYARASNGTEVPISIKGTNWFGMETGTIVPLGLWANGENGTTLYQIARFLSANKFNAVRLPVSVEYLLENTKPSKDLVNTYENRAISLEGYMEMLQSIIEAFAFRRIGVMISMHTLSGGEHGKVWFNDKYSEDDFLDAIDKLTENLCSKKYFNVMGIDLKNEPYEATWGDGSPVDFKAGAERIANRMLKRCPQWMGFVEGINGAHSFEVDGDVLSYYDWFGGGLQHAKKDPVEFSIPDKVVYAPHYYNPSVYPPPYMYERGTAGEQGAMNNYVELDDKTLRRNIEATMEHMFGFLRHDKGPAILLGEFVGLYAKDEHPMRTTKRASDFTIEVLLKDGYAGGFSWSLNPESAYQYNPADTFGHYTEGLLQDDWLTVNKEYLEGMAAMDALSDLKHFPCFETSGDKEEED